MITIIRPSGNMKRIGEVSKVTMSRLHDVQRGEHVQIIDEKNKVLNIAKVIEVHQIDFNKIAKLKMIA